MYCAQKCPASCALVCALRLEELSEPRTLLLGTLSLSLSLKGCHACGHPHTYVHTRVIVKGQCQNLNNLPRVVKVVAVKHSQSFELDIFSLWDNWFIVAPNLQLNLLPSSTSTENIRKFVLNLPSFIQSITRLLSVPLLMFPRWEHHHHCCCQAEVLTTSFL